MLLSLPNELIEYILSYLYAPSILVCKQVSKRVFSVIEGSIPLEYCVNLYAAHLVDNPDCLLPASTRLRLLNEHQNAWNRLSWSTKFDLPISPDPDPASAIRAWELTSSCVGFAEDHSLRFFRLPSGLRGVHQHEWTLEGFKFRIKDFATDMSQDLLVVIQRQTQLPDDFLHVHIRSLASGQPHPQAQNSVITYRIRAQDADRDWYAVHIFAGQLAVMLEYGVMLTSELILWDWKRGVVRTVITGPIYAFSFLTEQLLLMGMSRVVSSQSSSMVALDVLDVSDVPSFLDATNLPENEAVCQGLKWRSFAFPAFAARWRETTILRPYVHVRTDYAPPSTSNPFIPFSTSTTDRLYVVVLSNMGPHKDLVFFVRLSSLLALLTAAPAQHVFPWDQWGIQHTRLMQRDISSVWFCYVHGLKAVLPSDNPSKTELWDFNQAALKRGRALGKIPSNLEGAQYDCKEDDDVTSEIFIEPSTLCPHSFGHALFEEDMVTSLPCSIRSFNLINSDGSQNIGVMLSEDCIVWVDEERARVFSF